MKIVISTDDKAIDRWMLKQALQNANSLKGTFHYALMSHPNDFSLIELQNAISNCNVEIQRIDKEKSEIKLKNNSIVKFSVEPNISHLYGEGKLYLYVCKSIFGILYLRWGNRCEFLQLDAFSDLTIAVGVNAKRKIHFELETSFKDFLRQMDAFKWDTFSAVTLAAVSIQKVLRTDDEPVVTYVGKAMKTNCNKKCDYYLDADCDHSPCALVGDKILISKQCPYYVEQYLLSLKQQNNNENGNICLQQQSSQQR